MVLPSSDRRVYAVHPIPEICLIRLHRGEREDILNYLNRVLSESLSATYNEAANKTLEALSKVMKPRWPELFDPESPFGPFEEDVANVILIGDRRDLEEAIEVFMNAFTETHGQAVGKYCKFNIDGDYSEAVTGVLSRGHVAQCRDVFAKKNMEALLAALPARY